MKDYYICLGCDKIFNVSYLEKQTNVKFCPLCGSSKIEEVEELEKDLLVIKRHK